MKRTLDEKAEIGALAIRERNRKYRKASEDDIIRFFRQMRTYWSEWQVEIGWIKG